VSGLEPDIHERLRHPRRALVVSVPVWMDDGRTEVFYIRRVGHPRCESASAGPGKNSWSACN
jgi:glutamate dehydrogenase (NAD(P)+)